MWENTVWLKLPQTEIEEKDIYQGDMTGRFAYFRCELELPASAALTAGITASSRYRFWVNGRAVLSGPCKGDLHRQYYETIELTGYLRPGKNVFCAQVLYCDPCAVETQTDERAAIYGVLSPTAGHRLAVCGDVTGPDGGIIATVTTGKADWRVWLDNSFFLTSNETTQFLGAVIEDIDFHASPARWKEADFDASHWKQPAAASSVLPDNPLFLCGVQPRFTIREREIPLLYEREEHFLHAFLPTDGQSAGLLENGFTTVSPGSSLELILDAGAVKNGYPRYVFEGEDAEISFTYFEKFGGAGANGRRDDQSGGVAGLTDRIRLAGKQTIYEPFWVRTFRFIRIAVRAGETPVTVHTPAFRRTGYPLCAESSVRSSVPWVQQLWDICVRTLGNCMMETYMDCPYYEQLQFAMDTRLEALYTYVVTGDYALARKALLDFHYGMLPDGLTPGKYPSAYLQILSTFSLHYVIMLWEYFQQTGDVETIRLCRGDVDRILDYYDGKIGADGLVGRLGYWEFVDWQSDWNDTSGMPRAAKHGPSTIINLMYAYALSCGGLLLAATGRSALAEEYHSRRAAILQNVQKLCWDDKKKMYREGPAFPQFTRHAQAWAVLNRMTGAAGARELLSRAIADKDCLTCSFSTSFEWFRALEYAQLFEQMRLDLDEWIALLDLNCTTCPETPTDARSDCHAWSALPMYELIRTVAGVSRPDLTNRSLRIAPHLMDLPDLAGTAATPFGPVRFHYQRREDGKWQYELHIPPNTACTFVYPNGRETPLSGADHVLTE